MSEWCFI